MRTADPGLVLQKFGSTVLQSLVSQKEDFFDQGLERR